MSESESTPAPLGASDAPILTENGSREAEYAPFHPGSDAGVGSDAGRRCYVADGFSKQKYKYKPVATSVFKVAVLVPMSPGHTQRTSHPAQLLCAPATASRQNCRACLGSGQYFLVGLSWPSALLDQPYLYLVICYKKARECSTREIKQQQQQQQQILHGSAMNEL